MTGDYVTMSKKPIGRISLLQGILSPVYAVLGNHDHWVAAGKVRDGLEKLGYTVLQNRAVRLELKGAPLWVVGVDDGTTRHDDVAAAFQGVPDLGTRLVLTHTPTTAEKLPEGQGLACFAGHTHGGQLQIPKVTPALARLVGQPYLHGLYTVRGNTLHVTSGLGYGPGGPAVRYKMPPELAVLTLRVAPAPPSTH